MATLANAKLVSQNYYENAATQVQREIEKGDYVNMYPKVGVDIGYNEAVISSDFKYSLATEGYCSFTIIDREGKQVVYFAAMTPYSRNSMYKAYRHDLNSNFIFEPDPIHMSFLEANERVNTFLNVGTNFIVAQIVRTDLVPLTVSRIVIVKTEGSSKWRDWKLAYDVTSIDTGNPGYILVSSGNQDRILRITGGSVTKLDVFDESLQLLRTITLFDHQSDVNYTDETGQGRTGLSSVNVGYNSYGRPAPGTWSPQTQTLHMRHSCYNQYFNAAGARIGFFYNIHLSWSVPLNWILTGQGVQPSNLIPVKRNNKRYNLYSDSTWNTANGGVSDVDTGSTLCVTTDEYSGEIYCTIRNVRGNVNAAVIRRFAKPSTPYLTLALNSYPVLSGYTFNLPDGSPYGKGFAIRNAFTIDDLLFVNGRSVSGEKQLQLKFDLSRTQSVINDKDTLYLDPTSIVQNPFANAPTAVRSGFGSGFTTIVKNNNARYVFIKAGQQILEVSVAGGNFVWNTLTTTYPAIPGTIDGLTITAHGAYTWNGDAANPVFWALAKTSTYYRIIKHQAGVWSVASNEIAKAQIDSGNATRGDQAYAASIQAENTMLTEGGMMLCTFNYPHVSDTSSFHVFYNTNTESFEVKATMSAFPTKSYSGVMHQYPAGHQHSGSPFGWSRVFGYYTIRISIDLGSFRIISSRDPLGVHAPLTENEWLSGSKSRYEIVCSASSSVGLVAYVSEYPIFIGGYYTNIPQTTVALRPNSDNYIYATKGNGGRDDVQISTGVNKLSNTFSRVCLAMVRTNADSIVSSEVYSIDGTGLPDKYGKNNYVLCTTGKNVFWQDPKILLDENVEKVLTTLQGMVHDLIQSR